MAWSRPSCWLLTTFLLSTAAGELPALEARLVGPDGLCLGAAESPASLSPLGLAACGGAADSGQRWSLPAPGFTGEARLGGLCLDVDHSHSEDLTPIQLFPCHGGANQRWQHDTRGRLVGLAGKCLDLAAGSGNVEGPAVLFACGDAPAQSFLAEPYEAWGPVPAPFAAESATLLTTSDAAIAYQHDVNTLLRSADGGRTWAAVSRWDGYALSLAVEHGQPDRLWRITNNRKLWRSDDGGRSWRVLAEADENLSHLASSRVDPRVLVALGETGLWLSRDRGLTFQRYADLPATSQFERREIADLAENAAGEWVLADLRNCGSGGAGCDGHIFVTADFGRSWQSTFELTAASFVLSSSPADRQVLYSLEKDGDVARSSDGGHSFAQVGRLAGAIPAFFPIGIAADPASSAKVWAVFKNALYGSVDGGAHWLETARPLLADAGRAPASVSALGGGTLLVLANLSADTARSAVISRDGGAHWAIETPGVQGGILALAAAASPGRYYAYSVQGTATGQGLWRTDDRGRGWRELLPRPCVRRLEADPAEPDTFYFSTKEYCASTSAVPRGLWRSRDAGQTYENVSPPGLDADLGLLLAVRRGDATVLLTADEGNDGRLWRSADGGSSWQRVTVATSTVYQLQADAGTVYATGSGTPSRSTDGGATWAPLSGESHFTVGGGKMAYQAGGRIVVQLPAGGVVESPDPGHGIGLALDRYGRLYLLGGAAIFRSLDDGRSWQNLETGALGGYYDIVADPFDAELLLAATPSGPMLGRFADEAPLALGQGRFKASVTWRASDGAQGRGQGKNLTDDSGGFWFFSPERTEVVVKVLDGRPVNGRFWVFVGSLTDVEFDLEVVDQVTGEKRRYHNEAARFASFGDTLAFPLGEAQPAIEAATPSFYYPSASSQVTVAPHFEIEVAWRTAAGSGVGRGSRLSGETAAFTFFSPENVELLVNLIDGRAINGHYWVFAASLSDVAYTLRVRDLETGAVKEYENAAGSFASFGDTSAF